jgi:hypothetical protein
VLARCAHRNRNGTGTIRFSRPSAWSPMYQFAVTVRLFFAQRLELSDPSNETIGLRR